MIEKMNKLTFLVFYKEYDSFLTQLQQLGVVHIQPLSKACHAGSDTLHKLEDEYRQLLARPITQKAKQLTETLSKAQAELARYQADVKTLEPWGYFDNATIKKLAENGVATYFYKIPYKEFQHNYADYKENIVSQDGKFVYFIDFVPSTITNRHPALTPIPLPDITLAEAQKLTAKATSIVESLKKEIQQETEVHLNEVLAYRKQLANRISFEKTQCETASAADGKVKVLEGWFPVAQQKNVEAFLNKAECYYEIRQPQEGDNIPIQLSNNWYARMFERLTKMYGFPAYNEWDPTPVLATFFTLFFAICMGDAGYGIIITIYGILSMKGKTNNVPILGEMLEGCGSMITALGIATIFMGTLLGTFFGINIVEAGWIPKTTAVGSLLAWLQGNVPGTHYSIQMAASICIGVFHICLAMIIKAVLYTKKEGLKSQVSTWGWVLLIIGGVITGVLTLAGALSQQKMTIVLIGIGGVSALAIFLLNNIDRIVKKPVAGLIINPLAGLYDTYNMASGLMGDVLSYVRLYALCLAGSMLGGAFNMIGNMVWGDKTSYTCIFAIVIYIFGHVFNLLMSSISAFVHPLRLNFVEYFKNSGYEGTGTGYNPFEIKN